MERNEKEVQFDIYCAKCVHSGRSGDEWPCCECLETFWRDGSEKPSLFVAENSDPIMK